jgi:hypothetical protein
MIQLKKEGQYRLIETKGQTKILTLDNEQSSSSSKTYAWVNATEIGEILVASHKGHKTDHFLAIGKYRLYQVKDEPSLTDLLHLELSVGRGIWQGYLLTTGLPTTKNKRKRIIPTSEVITKSTI